MIAAYLIINNGYQAVMMAPTDVLANQHYESFKAVFEPLGISCQLLTSGLKKKEKNLAYENIENGNGNTERKCLYEKSRYLYHCHSCICGIGGLDLPLG